MNQEITPPIIPEIKNIDDVNNFDQIYTDVQITNSSFLCNNPNQNKLENFTYVKDESCAMDEINKNDIELSDSLLKSEENE